MNKRKKIRLLGIISFLAITSLGVYFILSNLEDNIVFFYPPSELSKINSSKNKVRVGGIVVENSIRNLDVNKIRFSLTDYKTSLIVEYKGLIPALFREKQGIVAEGNMNGEVFIASRLLAKHDENYMPPEIKKNLKQ